MTSEAELRLDYLREVGELLWPSPAEFSMDGPRSGQVTAEFILVPGARQPRILVPGHARRAAATAVRGYGENSSGVAALRTRVLAGLLRSGLGPLVLRDRVHVTVPEGGPAEPDGIDRYLRSVLGDVLVGLYVRPARRANRKPVLQVLTPAGEMVGFVKVGVDPLTRRLVRAERDALTALGAAPLRTVRPPEVLHHGEWRGLEVLVSSALPVWEPRRPMSEERLGTVLREIATAAGEHRAPLAGSAYWADLNKRLAGLDDGPETTALRAAADAIGAHAGGEELRFGAWHGDFSPWNLANLADGVPVWDWERFATGVPLGFDAFHYHLQSRVAGLPAEGIHERARGMAAGCAERAGELLAPFGTAAEPARRTALLYFLELSVRYLADRQADAGALLGAPGGWLIPVIDAEVARLASTSLKG
ncbi:hypothetical protein DPM19_15230 [Actinomadura craniellae]|uniref:Uncharacterized protein n=1 Tax=Actinomadura craniellae TaxID=2231787 RepID=A0A365H5P6_9ACTN|nr:phosphotransferase [Actinomadura craniellae]RAY14322.1 hypothetical protein DPM19_15230 [Actinomadura craniellae]